MMKLRSRSGLWFLALALPAVPLRPQEAGDRVLLQDGSSLDGEIKSEDYESLTIAVGNASRSVTWDTVESVSYGDGELLANAIDAYGGGRFEESLSQLEGLLGSDPPARAVLVQQALYFRGLDQARLQDFAAAIATLEDLIARFPKGRYLRSAAGALLDCALAKGDAAGASAALEKILTGAKAQETFQKESGLLKGRLLEAQKKYAEARALYQDVASSAGITPAGAEEARLGQARTLFLEGKKDEASRLFQSLTLEAKTKLVLAGAWNGLGDAWREEGRAKRDQERLMESVIAYLRGVVHYPPAPGEPTTEYEHALGGAALVYRYLSEIEQNPERKRINQDRAAERRALLEREFPSSPWLAELR